MTNSPNTKRICLRLPTALLNRLRNGEEKPSTMLHYALYDIYRRHYCDRLTNQEKQTLHSPYGERTDRTSFNLRLDATIYRYFKLNQINVTNAAILGLKLIGYGK